MNKFSDFMKEKNDFFEKAEKVSIDDIIGKEIIVDAFMNLTGSKFKKADYIAIRFTYEGKDKKEFFFFTGSGVLKNQLTQYEESLPFTAKLIKKESDNGEYYTFS